MHKALALFAVAFLLACAPEGDHPLMSSAAAKPTATALDPHDMEQQIGRTASELDQATNRMLAWYYSTRPGRQGATYNQDGEYIDLSFQQYLEPGAYRVVVPDLPRLLLGDWQLQYRYKHIARGVFEGWRTVEVDFADSTWTRLVPFFDGTDLEADIWWWYKDFYSNATADSLTYDRVSFRLWLRPPVLSEE